MPTQTKLPGSFFRVTRENGSTVWVNLDHVATISTTYYGADEFAGFSIEITGREESLEVTKAEEVKALARLLGFAPQRK